MPRFILLFAAAVILCAAPLRPVAAQARLTVTLNSHDFKPGPIYLKAGKPVRITLSNPSATAHEFRAPDFFYWSTMRNPIPGGVIRLESGETRTITLTPRRGSYKLKCGRFGHAFLGMSTMIIVH